MRATLAMVALAVLATVGVSRHYLVAAPAIDDPLREALSGIDFAPDRALLDGLLGGQAASDLIEIARDFDDEVDPGLRIRAYYALSLYPEDTMNALLDAVTEHTSNLVEGGIEVLYAKAAMSSLATLAVGATPTERTLMLGHFENALAHPVVDIRASAARALGQTGLPAARPILESRLGDESSPLALEAIRRALLELGGAAR